MDGKVCELAGAAFNMNTTFDPPKWAEKMKLRVDENAGVPKAGARIRCPIHLREHMLYPLLKDCQWRPEKELEEFSRDMLADFKVVYEERTAPGVSPLLSTMYCSMDIDSGELN